MGDLDELPAQLVELRELIRQAHAAIKDLDRLLREERKVVSDGATLARAAAADAARDEMTAFQEHIQAEMNRHARDLNRAVGAAREQVVKALMLTSLEENPGGGLKASFAGNLFEDDPAPKRRR